MEKRYKEIWKEINSNNASVLDIGGRKGELLKSNPSFRGKYENFDIILGKDITHPIKERKKYDFIVMSHVLEHLDDLRVPLQNARKMLKTNGKLIVCVPNALSFLHFLNYLFKRQLESYGGYETHLISFNIETISNLLEKEGFIIEKCKFLNPIISFGKFGEEILLVCKKVIKR
ncbi:MAG: class I SAM-dependent methyltransferase [Candidatus Aenigmatarchaeota archaeon]